MRIKEKLLFYACRNGLTNKVKKLLKKRFLGQPANVNIYSEFPDKETPLHSAIRYGHLGIVDILINSGADIEAKDYKGQTPLMYAVKYDRHEIVNLLTNNHANINIRDNDDFPLILLAAELDNFNILKHLIHKGINLNIYYKNESLLLYVMENIDINNNLRLAHILLYQDIDINVTSKHGKTPLYWAAYYNKIDIVKLLLEKGALINGNDDSCPIVASVENCYIKVTELLINYGYDVNQVDSIDNSLLVIAVNKKSIDTAKLLVKKGADVNFGKNYKYPLFEAVKNNHIKMAEFLINSGADIHIKNQISLMELAIKNGSIEIVELLITHGFNVFETGFQNKSLVRIAIENNYQTIADFLISKNAPYSKIDTIDKYSNTHEQMSIILELSEPEFITNKERLKKIVINAVQKYTSTYMFDALNLYPKEFIGSNLEHFLIHKLESGEIKLDDKWQNVLVRMGWSLCKETVIVSDVCPVCNGIGHVWITPGEGATYQEKERCPGCGGIGQLVTEKKDHFTGFMILKRGSGSNIEYGKAKI